MLHLFNTRTHLNHVIWNLGAYTSKEKNKPLAFPITSDRLLLKKHLDEQIREMTVDLEKQRDNVTFWKKLAGAAMKRITLFNKLRSSGL